MGRPKALLRVDGELLVERASRVLAEGGCDPVLAVLGAAADEVLATAALPALARAVHNPDWPTGMGSSLRAGLAAVPDSAEAAVVALVDQPLVAPESVRALVRAWRAGAVAAVATYGGKRRNPVLLSRAVFAEVARSATGDRGARAWLAAHQDLVAAVACDGLGDPADLDTEADLAALAQRPPPPRERV